MQETRRFTLRDTGASALDALLVLDGRPLQRIEGTVLEAQLQLTLGGEETFVLFVTHGSPYEELLHVYLINGTGRVVEHREMGGAYAPGIVRDVRGIGERELAFDFQGLRRLIVNERPTGFLRTRHRP